MLRRLAREGPLTVAELRGSFDLAKSTISKHLGVLEQAGLLRRLVFGRNHTCHLLPRGLVAAQRWLGRTAVDDRRRRRGE
jgi:DNA-binding transcriptional ArsR family regulator